MGRYRFLVTGMAMVFGWVGLGWAQGPGGRVQPRPVFEALDSDHDGKLSAAEIAAAPMVLKTLDRNGDGQLTPDELTPRLENAGAKPEELVQQLMAFDKNGDGVLTIDEVPERMQGLFKRADANHDGRLTPMEIRAMAAAQGAPNGAPVRPGMAGLQMRLDPILNALDADHDGTISAAEIAAASIALKTLDKNGDGELSGDEVKVRQQTPAERADHMLDEWDSNKDGRISKAEAPDRMQAMFEKIDANGDGFLDREELVKYFSTMGAGPRPAAAGETKKDEEKK